MSNLKAKSLQPVTPATRQACAASSETITIKRADALESAQMDLKDDQSIRRALLSAIQILDKRIGNNQRLIQGLENAN